MDYVRMFAVSSAGMTAERTRVEVAASNLAHAHTPYHPAAVGFQPMRVVAQAQPAAFAALLTAAGPEVTLEPANVLPRLLQDPGHPLANEQGFVAYPGVDPATEMVSLMSATRAYEANVAAMNTARALALKTLDIGRAG
ncbi:flagellar basal body rod protein FlgC [Ramlibacter sp. XY19]|uniref:flagellar basal body rod protein FlgC n=1 Tax=Ramlibacter paludis TaxID=2908000 RepID=UPI0023DAED4C|nr:flagellar basal body rod protein FlgC [Ramlibacter paludis]MCG2594948.1 flagellar basal body rod protein FlgC [Ramlibacter paludis]